LDRFNDEIIFFTKEDLMKKTIRFSMLLLLVLAVFWPSPAFAKGLFEDKVVFGGTYTLSGGETLNGNLVIMGGAVTTEAGSFVNGDVVLIGGVTEIGGEVNGSLIGIGGAVQLISGAVVNGDLVTIGATLSRDEGARVHGQIVNGIGIPFYLDIPNSGTIPVIPDEPDVPAIPRIPQAPGISVSFNPLLDMLWFFFRTFMFALLAVLVVIFFEKSTNRVSGAAIQQPLIAAGAGLLTAILAPLALIAMTVTIILIPVTLLTTLALIVAWLFGWIAVGLEVGKRIAALFNTEWAPAISAGVGTLILFLVLGGFSELVVCIGWLPLVLVGLWGLGAVILTRFGTQVYAPAGGLSTSDSPVLPENVEQPKSLTPVDKESADSLSQETTGMENNADKDGLADT
jgi:hypothetical protein